MRRFILVTFGIMLAVWAISRGSFSRAVQTDEPYSTARVSGGGARRTACSVEICRRARILYSGKVRRGQQYCSDSRRKFHHGWAGGL